MTSLYLDADDISVSRQGEALLKWVVPVEPDEIINIAADTTGHYPQGSGYFALLLPAGKYAVVRIGGDDPTLQQQPNEEGRR